MLFLILDLVHDFWRFFGVLFVLWSVGRLWLYQCKQTPFKLHKHIPSLATIKWQCEPFLDSRIWMMMMTTILLFPFSFYCSLTVAEPSPSTSISIQFEKPNHRRLHHHFVGYVGHSLSIFLLFSFLFSRIFFFFSVGSFSLHALPDTRRPN